MIHTEPYLTITELVLILLSQVLLSQEVSAQGYMRTKIGSLACKNRADWTKLSRIMERDDSRAVQRFITTRSLDQDCRKFFSALRVSVQIRSGEAVCIRPMGELECVWTSSDSVD